MVGGGWERGSGDGGEDDWVNIYMRRQSAQGTAALKWGTDLGYT
jgi:hypothetical protein